MIDKITNTIYKVLLVIGTVFFSTLIVIVFSQVVTRYFFGHTMAWVDELSRFLFVWMMFMGISLGIYKRKHIGIEFFMNLLPDDKRKKLDIGNELITIIFFAVVFWYGTNLTLRSTEMVSPVIGINMGLIYSIIPITSLLNIFYSILPILTANKSSGLVKEVE